MITNQLSEILKLSVAERILLVEAIWDSIANESNKKNAYQLSEEQINLLEDEMAAYIKNPDEGSSWEEIKQEYLIENELPFDYSQTGGESSHKGI